MRSGKRLSERWFNTVLWLVALAFAAFLIGLGSLVVGDLPQAEQRFTLEDFLDKGQARTSADALKQINRSRTTTDGRPSRPGSPSTRPAPPRPPPARPSRTG